MHKCLNFEDAACDIDICCAAPLLVYKHLCPESIAELKLMTKITDFATFLFWPFEGWSYDHLGDQDDVGEADEDENDDYDNKDDKDNGGEGNTNNDNEGNDQIWGTLTSNQDVTTININECLRWCRWWWWCSQC